MRINETVQIIETLKVYGEEYDTAQIYEEFIRSFSRWIRKDNLSPVKILRNDIESHDEFVMFIVGIEFMKVEEIDTSEFEKFFRSNICH